MSVVSRNSNNLAHIGLQVKLLSLALCSGAIPLPRPYERITLCEELALYGPLILGAMMRRLRGAPIDFINALDHCDIGKDGQDPKHR